MDSPFDDLIPKQAESNPFIDLVPSREQKIKTFKKYAGIDQPSVSTDIAAGMLHGLQGLGKQFPDLANIVPESMQNSLPYKPGMRPVDNVDAYKMLNTEDQPFYTPRGAAQLAGELVFPVGGGLAAKSKYAGEIGSKVRNIKDMFSPGKHVKDLLNDLGQGTKNSEEVSTSLAKDIRNAHDMRMDEASVFFNHALGRAGKESIYEKPDPLITTAMDKGKRIMDKAKDLGIGDLYDVFKSKPTFENAHRLQSELGVMIREYEKNPHLTMEESRQISQLKSARDLLKEDIANFLQKRDINSNENLLPSYNKGGELYNEHVSPYLSSKKLRDIVRGGKTVTKNIHSIFDSPTDIIDKATGELKIGSVNKIMQDLPESVKGKILFSKIGGYKNMLHPEEVFNSLREAESSGYSKYFTPELKQSMNQMIDKLAKQRFIKKSGKIVVAPLIAGAAGGLAAPFLIHHDTLRRNNIE